jgi:hypothetical protein
MSKKIDRALHGPSWVEVILGALISLVLGVLIGALLLVFRPVLIVKEMPKEDARDPKAVYFIEGSRDTTKGREASVKRKAFAEGRSVTVNEDELNALAGPAASFGTPAPKAGEKKAPEKKAPEKAAANTPATPPSDDLVSAGTPNFRIRDNALQVGVPVTISLDFLGINQKVVVQTRGGFAKEGETFVYKPDVFYVGSLPLERLPYVARHAREYFLNSQPIPDDVKASWAKLANVTVEGNSLKLTMP